MNVRLPRSVRSFSGPLRDDPHITRLIAITLGWLIFLALTRFDRFYSLINFQTMAAQFPEYGLMALGVMLCMITGGIDLSIVGNANLTGILMAYALLAPTEESGALPWFGVPTVLVGGAVIGAVLGYFNSVLINRFNISPILATLGAGELFRGISMALTNGAAVSRFSAQYAMAVNNRVLGNMVPVQISAMGRCAVTRYGARSLFRRSCRTEKSEAQKRSGGHVTMLSVSSTGNRTIAAHAIAWDAVFTLLTA